jgi:hypothetical protein
MPETFYTQAKIPCNKRIPGIISKKLDGDGGFNLALDSNDDRYTPDKVHTG